MFKFVPNFKIIIIIVVSFGAAVTAVLMYMNMFGAMQKDAGLERFVVATGDNQSKVIEKLMAEGFIKSPLAFKFAFKWKGGEIIQAGGYKISKAMNVWEIANVFAGGLYMKWVVIPEGLRKEEIADILADKLGWDNATKEKWITVDTVSDSGEKEGVFFPDTYLIPVEEDPLNVANRLRTKFNEKFAPYYKEATSQNIKWYTVIKIASIIQREAAGKSDMPLISGILWNRLLKDMKLDIDATVQYARGKTSGGWWSPIKPSDKNIDSPYNTYMHKGLPPHPIGNPGIDAIRAVLYPKKTDCFYYLHDGSGDIHCAETYEEHQENIEKYLR